MKLGLQGEFTVTIRRADGSVRNELKFKNLITNNGMDRIAGPVGTSYDWHVLWDRCVLSTNNTTPAVTDTAMGGGTTSTTTLSPFYNTEKVSSGAPNYIITWRNGFQFPAGTATGTWASIGLLVTSGSVLFCKTLIKSGGIPTTITILATESLDIRYDLTITPVLTDASGTVTINGTSHNWTCRPFAISDAFAVTEQRVSIGNAVYNLKGALMGGGTIALGAITGGALSANNNAPQTGFTAYFGNGSNLDPETASMSVYSNGSYTRSLTYNWSAAIVATNPAVTSVNGCTIRPGGISPPYQFIFSPPISKTVADALSLTFTVTWARL